MMILLGNLIMILFEIIRVIGSVIVDIFEIFGDVPPDLV